MIRWFVGVLLGGAAVVLAMLRWNSSVMPPPSPATPVIPPQSSIVQQPLTKTEVENATSPATTNIALPAVESERVGRLRRAREIVRHRAEVKKEWDDSAHWIDFIKAHALDVPRDPDVDFDVIQILSYCTLAAKPKTDPPEGLEGSKQLEENCAGLLPPDAEMLKVSADIEERLKDYPIVLYGKAMTEKGLTADERIEDFHRALDSGDPDIVQDVGSDFGMKNIGTPQGPIDVRAWVGANQLVRCQLGFDCSSNSSFFEKRCEKINCGSATTVQNVLGVWLTPAQYNSAELSATRYLDAVFKGGYDFPEAQFGEQQIRESAASPDQEDGTQSESKPP